MRKRRMKGREGSGGGLEASDGGKRGGGRVEHGGGANKVNMKDKLDGFEGVEWRGNIAKNCCTRVKLLKELLQ
jgi:hypothetical protein